jgi:hypothetical protein
MPALRCACPRCKQILEVAQALPARVECPRCRQRFVVNDPTKTDKASLIKRDHDAVRGLLATDAVRTPVRTFNRPAPMVVPSGVVSVAKRPKTGLGIVLFCLFGLFILGAILLTVILTRDDKPPAPVVAEAPVDMAPPLSARQMRINSAVNRGVGYLRNQVLNPAQKSYYFNDPGAGSNVGVLALAGLTLLECGVPSKDAAVEKVLQTVRQEAPRLRFTYSVALCILFLDRLSQCTDRPSDPANRELLQQFAVQLVAAQNTRGGWAYNSEVLSPERYQDLLEKLKTQRFPAGRFEGHYDDNSINQFATLALWAARKHGIGTGPSLAMVEKRYLENQNDDGSWGYRARDNGYLKDATTCAGLIGLAVGQGIRQDEQPGNTAQDPTKIPPIARGLEFIARTIGKDPRSLGQRSRDDRRKHTAELMELNRQWQEGPERSRKSVEQRITNIDNARMLKGTYFGSNSWGDLYFLWSVERVAVVFDLKQIEGKDWYEWGADVILNNQESDGSWRDRFPGIPDTCFALLFLQRANIAKDLTEKFRLVLGGSAVRAAPEPGGQSPPPPPARKD